MLGKIRIVNLWQNLFQLNSKTARNSRWQWWSWGNPNRDSRRPHTLLSFRNSQNFCRRSTAVVEGHLIDPTNIRRQHLNSMPARFSTIFHGPGGSASELRGLNKSRLLPIAHGLLVFGLAGSFGFRTNPALTPSVVFLIIAPTVVRLIEAALCSAAVHETLLAPNDSKARWQIGGAMRTYLAARGIAGREISLPQALV